MPAPNAITPAQLLRLIGTPDCPALVDVCIPDDFEADPYLIPTSFKHPHTDMAGLSARLGGRACIVICQKGLKLSQGAAALLRADGLEAQYLDGGMFAWRDAADAPRIPFAVLRTQCGALWVTRHRPKIDRIACPWLIRRFIDPSARFLFVSPDAVEGAAERFGATPFDITGARWSHEGERCTFDALLSSFGLCTKPLERLARIVRAADTDRHDLAPEAAGLLALSVGLSRQYKDDNAQLEAALPLYDALYRWARDGQNETHRSGFAQ